MGKLPQRSQKVLEAHPTGLVSLCCPQQMACSPNQPGCAHFTGGKGAPMGSQVYLRRSERFQNPLAAKSHLRKHSPYFICLSVRTDRSLPLRSDASFC